MGIQILEKGNSKIPAGIKAVLKVGFFDGKYQNGASIPSVAFWNEFGTFSKLNNPHIPPRPFMRNVVDDSDKIARLGNIAKIELEKGQSGDSVLNIIGGALVTMIKQSIQTLDKPKNHPYTIAKKGSSNPLVDTGAMLGAVSFKVEK